MGYKNIIIGVYKIYFSGDKRIYVGLTTNFFTRRCWHKRNLVNNTHTNIYLQRAFNKYGIENLNIELIQSCDRHELDEKEKHYIIQYDSFKSGFNLTSGGENCTLSDDVKKRISEKHKGKIVKPETREKLRKANLGKPQSIENRIRQSIYMKNRILTDEQKEKIRKGVSYKRSDETRKKMSLSNMNKRVTHETKLKLAVYFLKKKRPHSIVEIINGVIYVDGYLYIQKRGETYRTPPEEEQRLKEKALRIQAGIDKRKGKKRKPLSEETRLKISKGNKGKKRTIQQCIDNSNRQKGKKRSEEFKQKLRNYHKRKCESVNFF